MPAVDFGGVEHALGECPVVLDVGLDIERWQGWPLGQCVRERRRAVELLEGCERNASGAGVRYTEHTPKLQGTISCDVSFILCDQN